LFSDDCRVHRKAREYYENATLDPQLGELRYSRERRGEKAAKVKMGEETKMMKKEEEAEEHEAEERMKKKRDEENRKRKEKRRKVK
jgi:hypothetical protein